MKEVIVRTLVKFLMIDNVNPLIDLFRYTEDIINKLIEKGLVTRGIVSKPNLDFGDRPQITDIIENRFVIDYIYTKDNIDDHWQVIFSFGSFQSSKQLGIAINSDNYEMRIDNNYLELLKLTIKTIIKSDWKEIIWLMDKDSEMLSIALYPSIYRTENLARQLINEVMTKEYGIEWWNIYVPLQIQKKHRSRIRGYKSIVPGFTNVNEKLMSIDIGDLVTIFTLKEKKWLPIFDAKISNFLNNQLEMKFENLQKILNGQMETTRDLWKEQFSKYLSNDFIDCLKEFELNRNHVVHNKIIDRTAYNTISGSIQKVEEELKIGLQKIAEVVISTEQRKIIDKQLEMEREEHEAILRDIIESETRVRVRNAEEIADLYDEYLEEFYTEIYADLRFRNDIIIGDYRNIDISVESGVLFELTYKIDNEVVEIDYKIDLINDSQGAESIVIVSIQKGEESYLKHIRYTNGKVSYNTYQGNYMPETQDEFDISDLEELMNGFIKFLDSNFENMRENIDSEMYSIIKEGGERPLAEIPCYGCGECYICIDENYGTFGQCLNCAEMNDICLCDRCGSHFEGEEIEDEPNFCENCLDHFDKE